MWDDPVLYDLENADDPAFDLAFWSSLVSSLRPRRVLELASGTGRLTLPLARLGIADEIVGLDSSPSFVARVSRRFAPRHVAVRPYPLSRTRSRLRRRRGPRHPEPTHRMG